MRQRTADAAGEARRQVGATGEKAQQGFFDLLERDPLILGALGVAVGAAIAAAAPSTRLEDGAFGRERDDLFDRGRAEAEEAIEKVKETTAAAIDGARQGAGRAGSPPRPGNR